MTSCQVENDRPESETDGACTGTTSAPVARTGVKIMTPGAAGLRLGAGPAMGEMTPRGDGATGTRAVTTVGVMLTVGVNTTSHPTPRPSGLGPIDFSDRTASATTEAMSGPPAGLIRTAPWDSIP